MMFYINWKQTKNYPYQCCLVQDWTPSVDFYLSLEKIQSIAETSMNFSDWYDYGHANYMGFATGAD